MNLQLIGEHTIDVSLLPVSGAKILDLGCRGMTFKKAFPQHQVTSVDCDVLEGDHYMQCAVGGSDGRVGIKRYHDKQATQIVAGDEVDCFSLQTLSKMQQVSLWDVIKMDIEGSEMDVILSLEKPPARQISVEFHLHTGIYGQYAVRRMENKLAQLGYVTIQHQMESRHGLSMNYWDSLFILK